MTDDLVARWATLLVDYCLRVEPGETILIASELEARPLIEACFREVVLRGAHPIVRTELPGLAEYFVEHANQAQLSHLSPVSIREAEVADGRIRISAETDTRSMRGVDPEASGDRRPDAGPAPRAGEPEAVGTDPVSRRPPTPPMRRCRWPTTRLTSPEPCSSTVTTRSPPGRLWAVARPGSSISWRRSKKSGSRGTAPT